MTGERSGGVSRTWAQSTAPSSTRRRSRKIYLTSSTARTSSVSDVVIRLQRKRRSSTGKILLNFSSDTFSLLGFCPPELFSGRHQQKMPLEVTSRPLPVQHPLWFLLSLQQSLPTVPSSQLARECATSYPPLMRGDRPISLNVRRRRRSSQKKREVG